jgi:hypothetical protein
MSRNLMCVIIGILLGSLVAVVQAQTLRPHVFSLRSFEGLGIAINGYMDENGAITLKCAK